MKLLLILTSLWQLVIKSISGSTGTCTSWIATLTYESVDDAVENNAVVVVVRSEIHEAVYGFR